MPEGGQPAVIGAILPLTGATKRWLIGPYEASNWVWASTENPSQFELAIVDSEGNPDVARRAVSRW